MGDGGARKYASIGPGITKETRSLADENILETLAALSFFDSMMGKRGGLYTCHCWYI